MTFQKHVIFSEGDPKWQDFCFNSGPGVLYHSGSLKEHGPQRCYHALVNFEKAVTRQQNISEYKQNVSNGMQTVIFNLSKSRSPRFKSGKRCRMPPHGKSLFWEEFRGAGP
jgi:hypothetical protein